MGSCHSKNSKSSAPRVALDVFATPEEQQDGNTKASASTTSSVATESPPPNPSDEFSFHELLTKVFTVGTDCVMEDDDLGMVCGRVSAVNKATGEFGRQVLRITLQVIRSNGHVFCRVQLYAGILEYSKKRMLSELPLRPIQAEEKVKLKERGRLFANYGLGKHYMAYADKMIVSTHCGAAQISAEGRVMVDTASYLHFNPNDSSLSSKRRTGHSLRDPNAVCADSAGGRASSNDIPESALHLCYPTVCGFSFKAKSWGEIKVEDLSEIEFRGEAFSALVLDQNVKAMVQSLVQNIDKDTFTDVIEDKGGGCVFLLHGPPGVGKTLTAEAVSEMLRRPLYCIGVGELGITPETLENRLSRILQLAERWNAVLLIDECDIFLSQRSSHDVLRNAMVGIFLRLLEYYNGVLFLTSNRADDIDEAFQSRIGISLEYNALDMKSRKHVWTNLLDAAGITGLDVDKLSKFELNGRQIKTAIRLGSSFAKSTNEPVSLNHVIQSIKCADLKKQHSMFL